MLTYRKAYDSIHDSITRICKHLEIDNHDTIKNYFGMTVKEWFYEVLLQVNPEVYRLDNYGRSKEWIICHEYWRQLATLKDSGLPVELLLHHSNWYPHKVMKQWQGADSLNRDDYIRLKSFYTGFDEVYRALFVKRDKKKQKFNEINRLCHSIMKKNNPHIKVRDLKLLFSQYNHSVKLCTGAYYYTDLAFASNCGL